MAREIAKYLIVLLDLVWINSDRIDPTDSFDCVVQSYRFWICVTIAIFGVDAIRMIEQAMSIAGAIEFGNIRAFGDAEDPNHWSFIPLQPDLQRGEDGRPMISLFELGACAQLTFSTLWQASPDEISTLISLIGLVDAGAPDLQLGFAPIGSPRCRVLVADGAGGYSPIGTSETSGYPPYQAVFNLALTGAELEHARAALRGERGHLTIEYAAEMLLPKQGEARLSVDTERLLAWLAERGIGAEMPSGVLEQAITQGLIRVAGSPDGCFSPAWRQQLIAAAARMLPAWLSSHDAGLFELSLAGHGSQPVPLRLSTDLGQLLAPALS